MMNSPTVPFASLPWRLPFPAPPRRRRRPSDLLRRLFNGRETPSFLRFPRFINCSSSVDSPSFSPHPPDANSISSSPPFSFPASSSSPSPPISSPSSSSSSSSSSPSSFPASSSSPPPSPSSSSSETRFKYDVFISFQGADTRDNIVSQLDGALSRAGVTAFFDERELKPGKEIASSLFSAIKMSRISIVVFSENYASSRWCLSELEEIMECSRTRGQVVVPVFHKVEPTEVRRRTGKFGLAFAKYEKAPQGSELAEKAMRWGKSLTDAAGISGFHSRMFKSEFILVESIVKCILENLQMLSFHEDEGLIGMYPQAKKVEELLEIGSNDILSVGIWGAGGIGKTAIAGALFNRLYGFFDSYCFLADVREESKKRGLIDLRNELLRQILGRDDINIATPDIGSRILIDQLRRKKVLIVLDDLSDTAQLDFLIKDPTYFGCGSRIIITTRDRNVVKNADAIYNVKNLAESDAFELFSYCAFKQSYPPEEYLPVIRRLLAYAEGIPKVIKLLGSFLCKRSVVGWESALRRFQRSPDGGIGEVFRLSYDGLNDEEKQIFLDAACFFNGEDWSFVTKFVDSCDISAEIGLQSLIEKCLISCSGNRLQIDKISQTMAMEIVRKESTRDPSKRSRLWNYEEIHEVLTENMGTEYIEGISLDVSEEEDIKLIPRAFEKMRNLRFLRINNQWSSEGKCKVYLLEGLEYLPRKLSYLRWDSYPMRTLPAEFRPENLVELCMPNSRLVQLWEGPKNLRNLKSLNLSHSISLKKLPDLSTAPRLERIIAIGCVNLVSIKSKKSLEYLEHVDFCGCLNLKEFPEISWNIKTLLLADTGIEEIPPSIENFYQLAVLDMKNCKLLKSVPKVSHWLENLEFLDLSGCSNVTNFPEISSGLKHFLLNETAIDEIPSSIMGMEKIELLDLKNCPRLKSLPSGICKLKSLVELNLSGSSNFSCFPEILETMDGLNYLSLDGTSIRELPSSFENLRGLYSLDLENCKSLVSLPHGLCKLRFLEDLNLNGCSNLESLPQGIGNFESLRRVRASGCKSEIADSLVGSILSLQMLNISDCGITELHDGLMLLSSLSELDISRNYIKRIPSSIKQLPALRSLDLSYCHELESLSGLPAGLTRLIVLNCRSLETVGLSESCELQLYPLNNVETYVFANCPKLSQHAVDNIKAFAKRRIQVLASNLGVILNFRESLSHIGWITPEKMQYLLWSMYDLGNFHEALRGLYNSFFTDELNSEEPPSSLLSRILHDFHDQYGLEIQGFLGLFSLVAHLYLYYQGKPSTNFCLPDTEIPEWFCHQCDGSSIAVLIEPEPATHSSGRPILAGFAVSVLVGFDDYSDDKGIGITYEYNFGSNHFGTRHGSGHLRGWDGQRGKPLSVEGDYLFLGYDSSLPFDAVKGKKQFVGCSQDLDVVTFKFYVVDEDGNPLDSCAVKKCAIQPLHICDMTKSRKELLGRQDITKGLAKSFSSFFPKVFCSLDLFGAISLGILNVLGDLSVDIIHQVCGLRNVTRVHCVRAAVFNYPDYDTVAGQFMLMQQGGCLNIIINCENAGLLIGRQILNVLLGVAPLSVKLIEQPQLCQDHRAVSIEFSDVDGEDRYRTNKVKKCEIRPLDNHVMVRCYVDSSVAKIGCDVSWPLTDIRGDVCVIT